MTENKKESLQATQEELNAILLEVKKELAEQVLEALKSDKDFFTETFGLRLKINTVNEISNWLSDDTYKKLRDELDTIEEV